MRELVSLTDEQQARRLVAHLAVEAIQATVDDDDDEFVIWIHDDDDREKAALLLAEFQEDPNHERYEKAERKVRHVLKEAERLQKQNHNRSKQLRKRWEGSWWHCFPATYIMIALCVLVSLLCTNWEQMEKGQWGTPKLCNREDSALLNHLWFFDDTAKASYMGRFMQEWLSALSKQTQQRRLDQVLKKGPELSFVETRQVHLLSGWAGVQTLLKTGQLWRMTTPFFIHLSVAHIFMNLLAFRALGTGIEFRRGTKRFVVLCIYLGITSSLAQVFWDGPFFGGASGVLFGLFGYAWMKGRTKPQDGIGLSQQTVVLCLFWLLICMTGAMGGIANGAHVGGMLAGMLVGGRHALFKKMGFGSRNSSTS